MRRLPAALALTLLATPTLADTAVYTGTLGKSQIVVELTDVPTAGAAPAGRYLYLSQGIDIPLQSRPAQDGAIELAEEEACPADRCGEGQPAPIGATWSLKPSADGKALVGTWKGKTSLPVKLTLAARTRSEARTPLDLFNGSDQLTYGDDRRIAPDTAPYDVLRLDVPQVQGAEEGWPDARWRYVSDPRTKFPSPRIVSLAAGSPAKANDVMRDRQWQHSLSAFTCAGLQYAGFNEGGTHPSTDDGTLGGIDESTTVVQAVTPTVMSWRESGSLYCGGAHPANYSNAYVMDVREGRILSLGDMFTDVADGKPGPSLQAFVKERRPRPKTQSDTDFDTECGIDELVGEYLAASLVREGDRLMVVFGLQHLPHAINACGDDLVTMPVDQAAPLMTQGFSDLVLP